METPVQLLDKANASLATLTAEVGTLKAESLKSADAIKALTGERDTLKALADEACAKVASLEGEKATLAASITDLTGKLESAEAKLKDPALLAAAALVAAAPVAGLGGEGAPQASNAEKTKEIESKIKATDNAMEKATLRAQLRDL
jgi:hypothetical protein